MTKGWSPRPAHKAEGTEALKARAIDSSTTEKWAETFLKHVELVRKTGLDQCYRSDLSDVPYDLICGSLPWTEDEYLPVVEIVRQDKRWKRFKRWMATVHGYSPMAHFDL